MLGGTNDPNFYEQIHLTHPGKGLRTESAWLTTYGSPEITVAVIDGKIDWEHEDLGMGTDGYQNIWLNPGEDAWTDPNDPSTGDGIDNDGNGYIDDWKGWDFEYHSNDVRPVTTGVTADHGTAIAGIISAKTNNNKGVAGIAGGNNSEGVKVMTLNVYEDTGIKFSIFSLAKAIEYAMKKRVHILSLSLDCIENPLVSASIKKAKEEYGIMIVAAAGNSPSSSDPILFPANMPEVIAVGGITDGDIPAGNTAGKLDFVAPATDVFTTANANTYKDADETSIACAQVAGVAALLYSYYPCASHELILNVMKRTANPFGSITDYTPDSDGLLHAGWWGYGIPDASYAMLYLNEHSLNGPEHTIRNNQTWDELKLAKEDIIIESGATLTITADLYMPEGKKILVSYGAKLILDGGRISSNCLWKGIEVYGDSTRSTAFYGYVEVKNEGRIEHAHQGIRSFQGGIVSVSTGAVFYNNYESLVFERSHRKTFQVFISHAQFIGKGPVRMNGYRGIHRFIVMKESYWVNIDDCLFSNDFNGPVQHRGKAIQSYNSPVDIMNNQFYGLYYGVDMVGIKAIQHFTRIALNSFDQVARGISEVYHPMLYIGYNHFYLSGNRDEFSETIDHPQWGVYSFGSTPQIYYNTFSSDQPQQKNYGVIIRNSAWKQDFGLASGIQKNDFSNLHTGTQAEQYNRNLHIRCNNYSNMHNYAWSINPGITYANAIPEQGSHIPDPGKRAGNLFFDETEEEGSEKHIRSSIEFVYNAATDPDAAIPDYYTTPAVEVRTYGESNDESCGTSGGIGICGEEPCDVEVLPDWIENEADPFTRRVYQTELIRLYAEAEDYASAISYMEENNQEGAFSEILIPTYIESGHYTLAGELLSMINTTESRDQNYVSFYSLLLGMAENDESFAGANDNILEALYNLMDQTDDIGDLVRALMDIHYDLPFDPRPEEWGGSMERKGSFANETDTTESLAALPGESFLKLYPNPARDKVSVHFSAPENTGQPRSIVLRNVLGMKMAEHVLSDTDTFYPLNTSRLTSGIYFVTLEQGGRTTATRRLQIIR